MFNRYILLKIGSQHFLTGELVAEDVCLGCERKKYLHIPLSKRSRQSCYSLRKQYWYQFRKPVEVNAKYGMCHVFDAVRLNSGREKPRRRTVITTVEEPFDDSDDKEDAMQFLNPFREYLTSALEWMSWPFKKNEDTQTDAICVECGKVKKMLIPFHANRPVSHLRDYLNTHVFRLPHLHPMCLSSSSRKAEIKKSVIRNGRGNSTFQKNNEVNGSFCVSCSRISVFTPSSSCVFSSCPAKRYSLFHLVKHQQCPAVNCRKLIGTGLQKNYTPSGRTPRNKTYEKTITFVPAETHYFHYLRIFISKKYCFIPATFTFSLICPRTRMPSAFSVGKVAHYEDIPKPLLVSKIDAASSKRTDKQHYVAYVSLVFRLRCSVGKPNIHHIRRPQEPATVEKLTDVSNFPSKFGQDEHSFPILPVLLIFPFVCPLRNSGRSLVDKQSVENGTVLPFTCLRKISKDREKQRRKLRILVSKHYSVSSLLLTFPSFCIQKMNGTKPDNRSRPKPPEGEFHLSIPSVLIYFCFICPWRDHSNTRISEQSVRRQTVLPLTCPLAKKDKSNVTLPAINVELDTSAEEKKMLTGYIIVVSKSKGYCVYKLSLVLPLICYLPRYKELKQKKLLKPAVCTNSHCTTSISLIFPLICPWPKRSELSSRSTPEGDTVSQPILVSKNYQERAKLPYVHKRTGNCSSVSSFSLLFRLVCVLSSKSISSSCTTEGHQRKHISINQYMVLNHSCVYAVSVLFRMICASKERPTLFFPPPITGDYSKDSYTNFSFKTCCISPFMLFLPVICPWRMLRTAAIRTNGIKPTQTNLQFDMDTEQMSSDLTIDNRYVITDTVKHKVLSLVMKNRLNSQNQINPNKAVTHFISSSPFPMAVPKENVQERIQPVSRRSTHASLKSNVTLAHSDGSNLKANSSISVVPHRKPGNKIGGNVDENKDLIKKFYGFLKSVCSSAEEKEGIFM